MEGRPTFQGMESVCISYSGKDGQDYRSQHGAVEPPLGLGFRLCGRDRLITRIY
jgi:hypothetical protein